MNSFDVSFAMSDGSKTDGFFGKYSQGIIGLLRKISISGEIKSEMF